MLISKVYITKHALVRDIYELENVIQSDLSPDTIYADGDGGAVFYAGEWAVDRDVAIAQANEVRERQIKRLRIRMAHIEEQIDSLQSRDFTKKI